MLSYKDWTDKNKSKLVGVSSGDRRARYNQYKAAKEGADVPSKDKPKVVRSGTSRSQPGMDADVKDAVSIAKSMLDPWNNPPFRYPSDFDPKTLLYRQTCSLTENTSITPGNVFVGCKLFNGAPTTPAFTYTPNVAGTGTAFTLVALASSTPWATQTPDVAKILECRPNAAALSILVESPIQTVQGELVVGTVPIDAIVAPITYSELVAYPDMSVLALSSIAANEIIIPFSKLSHDANEFTSAGQGATDVNIPTFAITGAAANTVVRIRIIEYGEYKCKVTDPAFGAASRSNSSPSLINLMGKVNDSIQKEKYVVASKVRGNNWTDIAKRMYSGIKAIGRAVVPHGDMAIDILESLGG